MHAKVKLVCPVCGVGLGTYAFVANSNDAKWALNESSSKHLSEAHK